MKPVPWAHALLFSLVLSAALGLQAWALLGERWGVASNVASGRLLESPEIAGGVAVEQTFTMEARGLYAFTAHPRPAGKRLTGPLVFEVFDAAESGDHALYRLVTPAASVVGRRSFTWEFPPIELPAPRVFKVRIGLPDTPFGEGIQLDTLAHDLYPSGVLEVAGKQLWGDLVFETDAREAHMVERLGALGAAYPKALGSVPALLTWVLICNLAFARAIWVATKGRRAATGAPGTTPLGAQLTRLARTGPRRWFALGTLLLALLALALLRPVADPTIDLIERFPEAEKRTTAPRLHDGFWRLQLLTGNIGIEECIQANPSSRIIWTVDLPASPRLRVRAGLRPDAWDLPGDGALFRVGIDDAGTYEELTRYYANPALPTARGYASLNVDLERFAGRRVRLIFNTEPGPNQSAVHDATTWCSPTIESLTKQR
jgi:hypothetical protein